MCIYAYLYIYTCIYIYVGTYFYVYMCIYTYAFVCVYMYMYMYRGVQPAPRVVKRSDLAAFKVIAGSM